MAGFATVQGTRYPTMEAAQSMDLNAILGTFVDRGIWPYYDKLYLALSSGAGTLAQQYQPFSTPVGQLDPVCGINKTRVMTNMVAQNSFGATRCFILNSIGFNFPGS